MNFLILLLLCVLHVSSEESIIMEIISAMGAEEMTQSVECLPCNVKDLSLNPRTHIKQLGMMERALMPTPESWLARSAYMVTCRPVRDPVPSPKWMPPKEKQTQGGFLASTHMCTHARAS